MLAGLLQEAERARPAARGGPLDYSDASGLAFTREQQRRRDETRQRRPGCPERPERRQRQVPGHEEQ